MTSPLHAVVDIACHGDGGGGAWGLDEEDRDEGEAPENCVYT